MARGVAVDDEKLADEEAVLFSLTLAGTGPDLW